MAFSNIAKGLLACGCLAFASAGFASMNEGSISSVPFGKGPNGEDVKLFTLKSPKGVEVKITNYGGIVVSVMAPDKNGTLGDIVLGYDTLGEYIANNPYFGALIGRCGNRIAHGRFSLDGKDYVLACNDKTNHLHGGVRGFDKVVWSAAPEMTAEGPSLELSYVSKDGEEGYPGTLSVTATYTLSNDGALRLDFVATTDKPTICNLTNHSYFNLACGGTVLDHSVMIPADKITPVDATFIPDGSFMDVKGTPFDFNKPTPVGERIGERNVQLKNGLGYDHNYIIRKRAGELGLMARVSEPTSGRVLEVWSTQPGVQFYSGNFLDGTNKGKGGQVYEHRTGFCLEPQRYPDSPNKPQFPSVRLAPGETYRSSIVYKFKTL